MGPAEWNEWEVEWGCMVAGVKPKHVPDDTVTSVHKPKSGPRTAQSTQCVAPFQISVVSLN